MVGIGTIKLTLTSKVTAGKRQMEPPPDDEELVQKLLGSLPLVYQEEEEAVIIEEAHRSNTLSQKNERQTVHVANSATTSSTPRLSWKRC